jgi:hypothetical protein
MLAAAMTQASDANAINAARTVAGYLLPLGDSIGVGYGGNTAIEHRGIAATPGNRAELNTKASPTRKSFCGQCVSSASLGQQSGSNRK